MNSVMACAIRTLRQSAVPALYLSAVWMVPCASAGERDFVVYNNTGGDIHALLISPASMNTWAETALGTDPLIEGDSLTVPFNRSGEAALWDVKVSHADGIDQTWSRINLGQLSTLTLQLEDGRVAALVE
jgi:hypothetical protein